MEHPVSWAAVGLALISLMDNVIRWRYVLSRTDAVIAQAVERELRNSKAEVLTAAAATLLQRVEVLESKYKGVEK